MTVAAGNERRKRKPARAMLTRPEAADLLAWYDDHRRELPWRAAPSLTPDPYRVWLSEIMLQQTTVKTVGPYFARFLERWPDIGALAATLTEIADDKLRAALARLGAAVRER